MDAIVNNPKSTKPSYEELPGPQYRKTVLREVARERVGGGRFGVSTSHSRKLAGQIMGFEPLTELTRLEKEILTAHLKWYFESAQEDLRDKVQSLQDQGENGLLKRLTDPQDWKRRFKYMEHRSGMERTGFMGTYTSKSGYERVQDWFDSALAKKLKSPPVTIWDMGSSRCEFANAVQQKHGANVDVHASTLDLQPHLPVRHMHQIIGEYAPKEFEGKFDIVVAHRVVNWAMMPHLLIENGARSLAPGGTSIFEYQDAKGLDIVRLAQSPLNGLRQDLFRYYSGKDFDGAPEDFTKLLGTVVYEKTVEKIFDTLKRLSRQGFEIKVNQHQKGRGYMKYPLDDTDPTSWPFFIYIDRPKKG